MHHCTIPRIRTVPCRQRQVHSRAPPPSCARAISVQPRQLYPSPQARPRRPALSHQTQGSSVLLRDARLAELSFESRQTHKAKHHLNMRTLKMPHPSSLCLPTPALNPFSTQTLSPTPVPPLTPVLGQPVNSLLHALTPTQPLVLPGLSMHLYSGRREC